jgi:8-oxo-dGTP pyrophosphatase MutT (NUDIX family)
MHKEVNERSFGVIPFSIQGSGISIFLVQQISGAWHLPKGHAESNETPLETAARELKEETNLDIVRWLDAKPFVERYSFFRGKKSIYKEVQYFPAIVTGVVQFPSDEIIGGLWVPYTQVQATVTFPELKQLTKGVETWVQIHSPTW